MAPSIIDLPWLPSAPADFADRCRKIGSAGEPAGPAVQYLAGFRSSARHAALLARAIKRCREANADLAPLSNFRLGILASATFDLLLDCLPAAAARHGVALDLVTTPYDQVTDWDSINHVKLLIALESDLGFRFETDEVGGLHNVGELIDLIQKKVS